MDTPETSDRELRLLRSNHLSIEREADLYRRIAADPALQERFLAAQPFSPDEQRAHVQGLLGSGVTGAAPSTTPALVFQRAWADVVERIRSAFASMGQGQQLRPASGVRGPGEETGDREVVVFTGEAEVDGELVAIAASVLERDSSTSMQPLQFLVAVSNKDTDEVLPGARVRLASPAFTTGEAVSDAAGVARLSIATGGRWLMDGEEELVGDLVISVTLAQT